MRKGFIYLFLILFTLSAVITGCTNDKQQTSGEAQKKPVVKIRYAGTMQKSHNISMASKYWGELVEQMSNGEIKVEMYYNCELGSGREAIEALQMGNLEATETSVAALAGFTKAFNVLSLPFLFTDRQKAYNLLDGEFGSQLGEELKKVNLIGVSYYELGFRHLTNSKRPVKTPSDLKGLKVRTMENPIHMAIWNTLGAQATPLAWAELFTALQQGAMDGQENPLTLIQVNKIFEVQKYITLTGHVFDTTIVLMSKKAFDKLSPKHQEIIMEAAKKATEYQRKMAQEQEQTALAEIMNTGKNVITELSEQEKLEWRKATEPVYQQFAKEIGQETMDVVLGKK